MKNYRTLSSDRQISSLAKTNAAQRKNVVLHSGIRFGYYAFTLKNCDRD
jgi:hypothetical protein